MAKVITRACAGKVEKARKEILEIVRELPDSTSRDIATLMPDTPFGTISSVICDLKDRGVLKVSGNRPVVAKDNIARPQATYTLGDLDAVANGKVTRKRPTNNGYKARIKGLETKVAELETWKKKALERFPELGVAPAVLKARQLVAEELRSRHYATKADEVLAGKHDTSVSMTIAIKSLENKQ